jgi:hypothetical protein
MKICPINKNRGLLKKKDLFSLKYILIQKHVHGSNDYNPNLKSPLPSEMTTLKVKY